MNRTDQNLRGAISRNENRALWCAGFVVFGLILETIFAIWFHEPPGLIVRWGPVVADIIVALGVAGEVMLGRKARLHSEELTRRSEERAAKLEKEAADAKGRVADLERFTAPRRVSEEQLKQIADAIRHTAGDINLLIQYERTDAESWAYALDLLRVFC